MQIEIKVNKDFERFLNKLKEEYGEAFEKLNGLHSTQLDFSDFMNSFVEQETVADSSIDSSSNVISKDIVTLRSEMSKPHEKLIAYSKIFYEFQKMYGLRNAKKWFELEWNKALYLHDANTATFVAYCFAYDLKRIAEEGLFYLPEHNKPEPAKHLETFVDFVKEFINFTSNRTSGACGLPNLIPYMWYFWKKDVESNHYSRCHTPEQFAKSEIQRLIYGMNQPYTRDGIQSAFVNTSIFDREYFDALFGGMEFPDGRFAIDNKEEIIQFEKWFLEEMSAIKDRGRMFTFPVNSISLLKKDNKFIDKEFAKWASEHNRRWNDSNFFCDEDVTSLSNCCRLKSNIKDLGYFNSIGGSALKVGSVKVSTINLTRIALESEGNETKFLKILKDRLEINLKLLHVIRHIIKRNVEKKLLPNFVEGIIDFEHLYNTTGINGIYETMKVFGYTEVDLLGNINYTQKAYDFGGKIFNLCHQVLAEFAKDKDYMCNIEQVPAETAAVKFQQADKLLFGDSKCVVYKEEPNFYYDFSIDDINYHVPEDYMFKINNSTETCTIKDAITNNLDINENELNLFAYK